MERKWKLSHRIKAMLLTVTVLVSNLQVVPVRAEVQTQAADAVPVVSLEFEQVMNTGIGNLQFTDTYGTTAAAVTDSDGYQLTEREADYYLDLTGNKYLDVTKSDGTPLLTGQDSITILYKSYYQGGKSWAFYADSEDTTNVDAAKGSEASPNLNYFGITEAGTKVEKYGAGRASGEYNDLIQDPGSMVLNAPPVSKNTWKHIAVVIDHKEDGSETITLYQNGQVMGTSSNENAASLSEILGEDSIFRIGRANWGADGEYYDGYIDDFQVYGCALNSDQIMGKEARPEDQLLADFDFNTRNTESEKITFAGGSAEATVESGDEAIWKTYGEEKALDLRGAGKALYVTKKDGTPLLKDQETATVVFESFFEGSSQVNDWPFYAAQDVEQQEYGDQNYLAAAENNNRFSVPRQSFASLGKEDFDLNSTSAPVLKQWKTTAVVFDRTKTSLYVDGKLAASDERANAPVISDILGDKGGIFQIGRANWGGGEFYNGMLDNFQVYAGALSEDEVAALYQFDIPPAEEKKLLAEFTFDDADTGFSSEEAAARPFLIYDTDGDGDNELYLAEANQTYLNLLQGEYSPLKDKSEITISFDSKPDQSGSASKWLFFAAENIDVQEHSTEKYIGMRENSKSFTVENWKNNGFRTPSINDIDTSEFSGKWKHVDLVIDEEKTTLYVDGWKKGEVRTFYPISDIIGEDGGILQIGKANWASGEYYGGYIENFRIYDQAVVPEVDRIYVDNLSRDEEGKIKAVRVLAGHLQEALTVKAVLGEETVVLGPMDYEVSGYQSKCGEQTITLTCQGQSTQVLIDVYNEVVSTQKEVTDGDGHKMFTVNSTWWDYLSDPEREGRGNYNSDSYVMIRDKQGQIVSSESEFMQFNTAVSNYWQKQGLDTTKYHPIYWGDWYSLDEAYRVYQYSLANPMRYLPGDGVSWTEYGQNLYGAMWGYHAHQNCRASAQGIADQDLKADGTLTIGGMETPYFKDGMLAKDQNGDVYMNVYRNVPMPFQKVTDAVTGIDYYQFESGDKGKETVAISADTENTIQWVPVNECRDARDGHEGHDGVSFLPFNKNGDTKEVENCGFAMKMDFSFYTTYDGKVQNKTDPSKREPIIFKFEGDDDFFLYIDGQLVIDIGGAHGQCTGEVNFADQTVTISDIREPETYQVDGNGYDKAVVLKQPNQVRSFEEMGLDLDFSDPSVKHEAVIYYTERGKLEGNLRIRFNFPQENSISVRNIVDMKDVNESLKNQMEAVIAGEKFPLSVEADYKDEEFAAVDGEAVAYYDGTKYTEGTISGGNLELRNGESVLLHQRVPDSEEDQGFVNTPGDLFKVQQTVNAKKYTQSWKLTDTNGEILGSGDGAVIDDPNSAYPDGGENKEGQFALYNKDAKTVVDEKSGAENINLSAEYTNTVRVNTISVTKEMRTIQDAEDAKDKAFAFQVRLSDLFGSESGETVYTGKYEVYKGDIFQEEKTAEDGKILLKPGETAVITGIPALTKYQIREEADDVYQTVGSPEITGTIQADTAPVNAEIINMLRPASAFYAWRDKETILPIEGGVTTLYAEDGTALERSQLPYTSAGNYRIAIAADGSGIVFTGYKYGNTVIEYMGASGLPTTATVHVYEPDNKAYVLDYGIPVDLNAKEDDSFGISQIEGTENQYKVSGSRLMIAGVDAAVEFLGFRVHEDGTDNWIYQKNSATGKSTLNWSGSSVLYTPEVFMKDPDVYDYRADVKKDLDTDMDDPASTSADGVRMNGTLTVVPAEVVYYEDDFKVISADGTYVKEGLSKNLIQSNDQDGVYGYDEAYAGISGSVGTDVSDAISSDLLLHYDFSRITSAKDQTVIPDASGNEYTGTIRNHGAKVTGDVLTLPGGEHTSDAAYIELPAEVFTDQEELTVSMWLKNETVREDAAANDYVAMYVGAKVNTGDWPQTYWLLNPQNSFKRYKSVMTLGGFEKEKGFSPTSLNGKDEDTNADGMKGVITDSGWALYTTVFEGTTLTAYYNGVKIGTVDTGITLKDLGGNLEAYIARSPFVDCHDDPYYKGGIRDLRIYKKALSEDQVSGMAKELYTLPYDSAGSVTRLVADSDERGTMEFTFTGNGFDLVGRSTTETAGVAVTVRNAENNRIVKNIIRDTSYANGELYQLPLISVKDLEYGTYKVTVRAMKTKHRSDPEKSNESVYIDGVRIYNPAGVGESAENTEVTKYYLSSEYKVDIPEIRELLLGSVRFENLEDILKNSGIVKEDETEDGNTQQTTTSPVASSISLVTFDPDQGTVLSHGGSSEVENPTVGNPIDQVQSLEEILKRGPNNEVYLAKGNAIAFRAVPVNDVQIPESARTLQVEAKKAAGSEQSPAIVEVLTEDRNSEGQYDPQTISLMTYTPMYYAINLDKCKRYPDGSRLVVFASAGDSMVSFTNLKVKGYTLQALDSSDFGVQREAVADVYVMMRAMFANVLKPEDTQQKVIPFIDVAAGTWYEEAVRYVYEHQIMTGMDGTHFGPEADVSRAQLAVILYRMEGSPNVDYTNAFRDVADEQYYTDAVMWASSKEAGIITGYTVGDKKGCFGPDDPITREQMAVMLYRYARYKGYDIENTLNMTDFADKAEISQFAEEAVAWAAAERLIKGENGFIHPQGNTNRAMCAVIIQRFMKL